MTNSNLEDLTFYLNARNREAHGELSKRGHILGGRSHIRFGIPPVLGPIKTSRPT